MEKLLHIVAHFRLDGDVTEARPLGNGLINDTYKVVTANPDTPDYVLQRINHHVFTDVDMLQSNIGLVTAHMRKKLTAAGEGDIDRKVLRFMPAENGKTYWFDGESYWRMMVFIGDTVTREVVDAESSYCAGVAFGQFQAMLADIPATLGDTIPNFHNMEFRLAQLREAVKLNLGGRVDKVQPIIDEMEKRAEAMCLGERLYREGKLPKRVCHCDTKVNNMLFNLDGTVCCVIDLDTVMPNFIFSDYGDFLRTGANYVAEDEPDLCKVGFNMEIFKAFTRGYLESAKAFLLPIEIENLPYAVALFPYMQCVRFLTDYINGDTYYRIKYPEHNLVRTKCQLRLLECIEECMPAMKAYIAGLM